MKLAGLNLREEKVIQLADNIIKYADNEAIKLKASNAEMYAAIGLSAGVVGYTDGRFDKPQRQRSEGDT